MSFADVKRAGKRRTMQRMVPGRWMRGRIATLSLCLVLRGLVLAPGAAAQSGDAQSAGAPNGVAHTEGASIVIDLETHQVLHDRSADAARTAATRAATAA